MYTVTDQTGRMVAMERFPARRIVSLVPSETELLFDIGLEDEVVGITKFCVHPDQWYHSKERVGGTKRIDIEKIRAIHPDLVLANKEENEKDQVKTLIETVPVWVSDVSDLRDACDMIAAIGRLTGRIHESEKIALDIAERFARLVPMNSPISCCYLIWREPFMTVGGDTFIHDMLERCGFRNVFADLRRYPSLSPGQLQDAEPQLVLLSSEPYPFKEKHRQEIATLLPAAEIRFVDGEIFSWYGSRLLYAPDYFASLIQSLAIN